MFVEIATGYFILCGDQGKLHRVSHLSVVLKSGSSWQSMKILLRRVGKCTKMENKRGQRGREGREGAGEAGIGDEQQRMWGQRWGVRLETGRAPLHPLCPRPHTSFWPRSRTGQAVGRKMAAGILSHLPILLP